MPAVVVFNLTVPGNTLRAILGDADVGTSITDGGARQQQEQEQQQQTS
jgi:hypothetical protein